MPRETLTQRVAILEEQVVALSDLYGELVAFRAETRAELGKVHAEFAKVRAEIRAGDEETRRQMRLLYEDLIERIARLQEGIDRRNGIV